MFGIIIICLVVVTSVGLILRRYRKLNKIFRQIPTKLKSVPILGHALCFAGDGTDRMQVLQKLGRESFNFNGLISFWLTYKLLVIVSDAEAAELIMKKCLNKDDLINLAKPLIGNGSIFAPVSIWRPRRKALSPTFGLKTLNTFVKIFSKQGAIMVMQLKKCVGSVNISIFEYITKYSLDSVCETTLGIEVKSQGDPNHPVLRAFTGFCNMAAHRVVRPWLYPKMIYKFMPNFYLHEEYVSTLKNFVGKVIKSKREENEKKLNYNNNSISEHCNENLQTKTFLDLLMDSSDPINTDVVLQEETLVMVLAGTDTSAVGASFVALTLAKYPEIQEKVYNEIKKELGNADIPIEADDLPKLKYLEAVIKETLRMYPPVPLIVRKVEHPVTLPTGLTLTPGVGIVIHIWAMHRNPKYWGDDAEEFKPERFFSSPPKHPAAYMPFSYGLRSCLGYQYAMMSVKVAIATLLRTYRLLPPCNPEGSVTENFTNKKEPFPVTFEIMMKHKDKFEIRLQHRN